MARGKHERRHEEAGSRHPAPQTKSALLCSLPHKEKSNRSKVHVQAGGNKDPHRLANTSTVSLLRASLMFSPPAAQQRPLVLAAVCFCSVLGATLRLLRLFFLLSFYFLITLRKEAFFRIEKSSEPLLHILQSSTHLFQTYYFFLLAVSAFARRPPPSICSVLLYSAL